MIKKYELCIEAVYTIIPSMHQYVALGVCMLYIIIMIILNIVVQTCTLKQYIV